MSTIVTYTMCIHTVVKGELKTFEYASPHVPADGNILKDCDGKRYLVTEVEILMYNPNIIHIYCIEGDEEPCETDSKKEDSEGNLLSFPKPS